MRKIKIAQIGVGHDHANAVMATLKLQSDIFETVGFCRVPEDEGNIPEIYAGRDSFYEGVLELTPEEILNYDGLDAVAIETEDRALTKYALLAAERGLHIHMDKPGGVDDNEFNRLIETVKAKNLVFNVGYMYRYNPAIIKLKDDIKSGKLGDIISVEAQMNCKLGKEKRDWLGNYKGGMLYYLGCHMVDLVFSIMGKPEEIIPFNCSAGTDGVTAEDFGMAVYKYKNGVSFAKSTAIETGGFQRRQLVVVGTKGTVEIRPLEWLGGDMPQVFTPQSTKVREAFSGEWFEKGEITTTATFGRYDAMFRAFASFVRGEKTNQFDYDYEKQLHDVLLASCGIIKCKEKI